MKQEIQQNAYADWYIYPYGENYISYRRGTVAYLVLGCLPIPLNR